MNCSLPKPRLFMGCSCSSGSGPSYSSQERTMFSGHCLGGMSLFLLYQPVSCVSAVLPQSPHTLSGPNTKLLRLLHIKNLLALWWPWEDSPFSCVQCWQAACGRWRGLHSHFLGIFHELSTARPSQYLHFGAWHDKRMESLGISPLSLNLFISSCTKVRTNSSNTRHSVQCRNR